MRRWMSGGTRAVHDGIDVVRIVHEAQVVERRGRRFMQIVRRDDALGEDPLAQAASTSPSGTCVPREAAARSDRSRTRARATD